MSRNSHRSIEFWIIFFFQLLLLTVPLFFTWVNEELFEFNKIILIYGYTVIIASLWVAQMIYQKKLLWKKTPFDIPIALFFISQLLSTIFSINFHTSFFGYYTRFNGGLLSTICYITLFYAFIQNVQKKHLPGLFFSTFLSALIVSALAIPEHFGHSFSCLLINVSRGSNLSAEIYNTSCWIQDVQTRVFATFGQPNWLAAYAITLIPVGILLSSGELESDETFRIKSWQRWFYAITSVALFMTLLFTKSRSGFIGLAIGIVFGLGLLLARSIFSRFFTGKQVPFTISSIFSVSKKLPVTIFVSLALLSCLVFGTPYSPTLSAFLTQQKNPAPAQPAVAAQPVNRLDEGGTDSGEIRRIVWSGAIKVWQRYPILGSGVETFAYSYYKDRPMAHNLVSEWDFLYNKAHNEFLNFLATTGVIGLAAYLFFLGSVTLVPVLPLPLSSWLFSKRISSIDPHELTEKQRQNSYLLGAAFSSGIVALSVSNFFGFSTVMVSTLLFLLPGFWYVFSQFSDKKSVIEKSDESMSTTQIVVYCLLFFISLALLFRVYNMWESDRVFAEGKQNSQANQVNVGLSLLQQSVLMSPDEPYFYEELAVTDARIAAALGSNENATAAAQFAQSAIDLSNQMIAMNPVNLNFYKSRTRIFSLLSQLDPKFIEKARENLVTARTLAPTDPKLLYNIALIDLGMDKRDEGIAELKQVLEMKPNYIQPHLSLAAEYEKDGKLDMAKSEYEYILKNIQQADPTSIEKLKQIATASAKIATASAKATPHK